ncbi:MAG: SRPBCC family protein [Armatimonadetes bacterium]|nr:SRPBCC family protein [Armatimonadota bacterium]
MGKTHQSTKISRSPADVWAAIKDFHDMHWCPNVITNLKNAGDKAGHEIGSKRVLNDAFHETLHEIDDEGMTFRYSIDDGPPPISRADISNYFGVVTVKADGNGTLVEWTSSWEGSNEESHEFCHQIYLALLADMKASLEG